MILFPSNLQAGKPSFDFVHVRTQSSPSSLIDSDGHLDAGGRVSPRYETPPGTPPPPYQVGGSSGTKKNSFEVGIRDKDTRQ